ncbi:complex I intermediate-associated protein 30-domain-containing protein [Blyttiomyces helicus]|uniref:Complex I intermediate-associated protein 30-domain-containing protein n=1 Tax=Blyttiomyces helicus TaxID=388810 RepID=A0A4P9W977_9FUNG|nr:complex I intermediate-associated protein 30-domain-containing protein [Blyttiomyces helicus]|eukprot:RKO89099.1 complex I intermediate-associated protein 30-domain-containing protein [Blyttiomyces helicus]
MFALPTLLFFFATGAAARPTQQLPLSASRLALFGGDVPWNASRWLAVDDRVRGGSSQSHLTAIPGSNSALFSGILDTKTLGGAGFASQRAVPTSSVSWDLSAWDGIELVTVKEDGKRYALNLMSDLGPRRPDGRVESTIEYKYSFDSNPAGAGAARSIQWADFSAFYRGRPVPDASPIDPARIAAISIMCQSYFAQQDGPFELEISSVAAV